MNKEILKQCNLWSWILIFTGVITFYKQHDYIKVYMHYWHPLSWIIVLLLSVVCIFTDHSILEFIQVNAKPKGKIEKVSIWKAN